MTQKEKDRIAELERKIDELLARPVVQPIIVQPLPVAPRPVPQPWTWPYYPYRVTWGQGSAGGYQPSGQTYNKDGGISL